MRRQRANATPWAAAFARCPWRPTSLNVGATRPYGLVLLANQAPSLARSRPDAQRQFSIQLKLFTLLRENCLFPDIPALGSTCRRGFNHHSDSITTGPVWTLTCDWSPLRDHRPPDPAETAVLLGSRVVGAATALVGPHPECHAAPHFRISSSLMPGERSRELSPSLLRSLHSVPHVKAAWSQGRQAL